MGGTIRLVEQLGDEPQTVTVVQADVVPHFMEASTGRNKNGLVKDSVLFENSLVGRITVFQENCDPTCVHSWDQRVSRCQVLVSAVPFLYCAEISSWVTELKCKGGAGGRSEPTFLLQASVIERILLSAAVRTYNNGFWMDYSHTLIFLFSEGLPMSKVSKGKTP